MTFKSKVASLLFLATPIAAGALQVGQSLPSDLKAKNQDGKLVEFSKLKGKYILIYFYPKDDTPGCTKEACDLRDNYGEFRKLNVEIFGVSKQDETSHKKFIAKHKLPFDLLVDNDGALAKILGVGTIPVIGIHKRQSLLIDPDGKVIHRYDDVDPSTHREIILSDLKESIKARGK